MEVEFDDPTECVNTVFDTYTVAIFNSIDDVMYYYCVPIESAQRIEQELKKQDKFLYKHQNLKYPDQYNFITRTFYRQISRLY